MFGNWVKTSILFAGIIALFGAIGAAIGGAQGMLIALLFGAGMNLFAYWNSDRMVLSMYHAREVDASSGGRFYAMVQELSARAGLPGAVRNMRPWRPPAASCSCSPSANCAV